MNRRQFLGSASAAGLAGIGGCLTTLGLRSDGNDPEDVIDDWQEEKQRATGEPITVETVVSNPDRFRCEDEAFEALGEHAFDTFPNDSISVGGGGSGRMSVRRVLRYSREGEVIEIPSVSFETLKAEMPKYVEVRLYDEAEEGELIEECRFPVDVGDVAQQLY